MFLPLFSGRLASSSAAQTAAPEEIDEHQWILYRLRSAGYAGLATQKAAELYLEQYLPWAKEHREELAAFRKKKRKTRTPPEQPVGFGESQASRRRGRIAK